MQRFTPHTISTGAHTSKEIAQVLARPSTLAQHQRNPKSPQSPGTLGTAKCAPRGLTAASIPLRLSQQHTGKRGQNNHHESIRANLSSCLHKLSAPYSSVEMDIKSTYCSRLWLSHVADEPCSLGVTMLMQKSFHFGVRCRGSTTCG